MIETARLIIKPLTYDQLVKYSQCDNALEKELNLNETSRTISPELKEAFEATILPNVADHTKNYLYSTLWTAISKAENKMIGDLCIVGEPNADGEIEIGYGTYDEFQGRGFMTELVGGIIEWARTQPPVKSIIASTDKTNTASYKVLQKNNFIRIAETDALFHWKLDLLKLKRTNSEDLDFQKLVAELDMDLAIRDGEDHAFYAQYNKIAAIKYAVVVYENDIAVGCGAIKEYEENVMEIKRMFVVPEKRGRGIASMVLKALENWTKELGYRKCILETGLKQPEAIGLYKKNDFVIIRNYGQYADVEGSMCFEKVLG